MVNFAGIYLIIKKSNVELLKKFKMAFSRVNKLNKQIFSGQIFTENSQIGSLNEKKTQTHVYITNDYRVSF